MYSFPYPRKKREYHEVEIVKFNFIKVALSKANNPYIVVGMRSKNGKNLKWLAVKTEKGEKAMKRGLAHLGFAGDISNLMNAHIDDQKGYFHRPPFKIRACLKKEEWKGKYYWLITGWQHDEKQKRD